MSSVLQPGAQSSGNTVAVFGSEVEISEAKSELRRAVMRLRERGLLESASFVAELLSHLQSTNVKCAVPLEVDEEDDE